jgi:predicted RND superfamily exporter protein
MSELAPLDPLRFAIFAGVGLAAAIALAVLRPDLTLRFPRSVLALLAAVTALALVALVRPDPVGLRLTIDPSTEPLLPRGDPAVDGYRNAVADFGDDQVYAIAMETDGDVFTHAHLSALRRVRDRVSRLEGVRSVQSLVSANTFRWDAAGDWIEIEPFIDEIPSDPAALAALRERALAYPLYVRTLVSPDGRAAALNVSFREMSDGQFIAADLDGRIRAILRDESRPGRSFHVSGRPHIKAVMYHAMVRDLRVLVPVSFLVVAAVLVPLAGSLRGVLLPLVNVGLAVTWTFGAVAALGRPISVLTVLLAPTLLAVGSVYGVHVVGRYEEEAQQADSAADACGRALGYLVIPVLISGLTTGIGFASLCITNVPAVFELGAFSALGVAAITLCTLTGAPAALALLPLRRARRRGAGFAWVSGGLERLLARMNALSRERPLAVIAFYVGLAVAGLLLVPRIDVDTDYLTFFDADSEVRRDFTRVNELLAGVVPLYVVVDGGRPDALREPDALRALERLQQRLDAIPGVTRTHSLLDTLRLMNRALARDDPAEERVPDTRGGVAELFFLLPKSDLQRFATVDQSSANVIVRTGVVGSHALRELGDRIEHALADDLPPGFQARVTGNAVLLARAADGVASSQSRSIGATTAAVFFVLWLSLRSFPLALLAMVPNLVPVAIFFGVLGAGLAPLSLPTSLIAAIALGLAIDSTVHFLFRYRVERRAGHAPARAAELCGRHVGRDIAVAELMLACGFLAVAASQFATLREFATLSSFTVLLCALCDLMLLPALLVRLRV